MIDGGRDPADDLDSKRSLTPALDAGRALAGALGVDPGAVRIAPGPASGKELASVQSAPLIERLRQMMSDSDNVMAESIAREVAAEMQRPLSFAGAVDAVTSRLASAGVDMKGASLVDSSGLSVLDRLTATTLDDVVGAAAGPDQPQLRPLVDLLPIAGGSGTLSDRFLDPDTSRGAAGWLRAKTGSLTGHQRAGRCGHRPGRSGADLRADLQRRGPDRTNRDRRLGGHAAFVRVRVVSAATELTVGRAVDWEFAAAVGSRLARPAPPATRLHAQSGHRRACGGVPLAPSRRYAR